MAILLKDPLPPGATQRLFDEAKAQGHALLVIFSDVHRGYAPSTIARDVVPANTYTEYSATIAQDEDHLAAIKRGAAEGHAAWVKEVYDLSRAFDQARGGKELLSAEAQAWLEERAQRKREQVAALDAAAVAKPWWKKIFG